jgi:hypothetical protein
MLSFKQFLLESCDYMYHATNDYNLSDIIDSKKIKIHKPSHGTDQDCWPDGSCNKRSYWTHSPEIAKSFHPSEGKPVLLRAKKSDHQFKRESVTGDHYLEKSIPTKNIEMFHDGSWKNIHSIDEAMKDYRGGWRGEIKSYDDSYYDKKLDTLKTDDGETVGWRFKLEPKQKIHSFASDIIPKDDAVIHRGMSHSEYENIMKTKKIRSNGSGNLGNEQKGLTYFTTDPDSAGMYANSFAMSKHIPTPEKPAYIVSIKRPHESRIKKVEGTAEHEIGVAGDISSDEIVAVHKGHVIEHNPASKHISDSGFRGRGEYEKNLWKTKQYGKTKCGATSRLHWERIK